jgi:hypothetical protein
MLHRLLQSQNHVVFSTGFGLGPRCNLHLPQQLLVLTSHKRSIFKGDTRTLLGIVSARYFTVNHVYRIRLLLDTRVLVLQIRANYRDRNDCIQKTFRRYRTLVKAISCCSVLSGVQICIVVGN